MKISELVAALTAELIRGNDAEIGFTVPLRLTCARDEYLSDMRWTVNGVEYRTYIGDSLYKVLQPEQMEFRHRDDGVMEIVLT